MIAYDSSVRMKVRLIELLLVDSFEMSANGNNVGYSEHRKRGRRLQEGETHEQWCLSFFSPNLVTDEEQSLRTVVTDLLQLI